MPRQSRKLSESKTYHVMIRGNEKRNIFLDDEDRMRFIDTLYDKNKDKLFSIYAYCLMDNHVHLLIFEGEDQLPRIMKRINVSYAYYFNKKYKRVGHLFQDRYKSEIIDGEGYLLTAVRYIHNNPVKSGIVKNASLYKWSSYINYINDKSYLKDIVETKTVLSVFSTNGEKAVRMFEEYTNSSFEDNFIDCVEYDDRRAILNENEAKSFIGNYLKANSVELEGLKARENIKKRNELIRSLKEHSGLSIRQLAGILGIDRNIIQRVR